MTRDHRFDTVIDDEEYRLLNKACQLAREIALYLGRDKTPEECGAIAGRIVGAVLRELKPSFGNLIRMYAWVPRDMG